MHNVKFRNTIAKIRLPSHDLNIESGKRTLIERNERKGILCDKNGKENEYLFILDLIGNLL